MDTLLLFAVFAGIVLLLFQILYLKIPAFIALLISSIAVGGIACMAPQIIIDTCISGMGGTLGFVATVVGLGAMFGAILEHIGGAKAIAQFLLKSFGQKNGPMAMATSGFLIAIPVFFDVAFIILVPILYALQRSTKKSLLYYAIPLLSGLAITHAFIPPTPGPVAVAEIIGADLGWVILAGFLAGLPTLLISGIWFGKYIGKKIHLEAPELVDEEDAKLQLPSIAPILLIIAVPIVLILLATFSKSGLLNLGALNYWIVLLGHPISALIIANLLAWYILGQGNGFTKEQLWKVTTKSMAPAGTIILLTGAGGVFKQMLINTGTGKMLAEGMVNMGIPVIVFAFLAAAIIRLLQGSATVAMITGAGLIAPLLVDNSFSGFQLASLVIAVAAGGSILSHVNDSGFWLVSQYLGMDERQTFRSWSVMTTLLALVGFAMASLLFLVG